MSTQPLTGAGPVERLTPVTRGEAAALAAGLLKLVERHSWLAKEPLIEGYTRLLLTVPDEPLNPGLEAMLQNDLRAAHDETGRLTERVEYLRAEVAELQRQLADERASIKPNPAIERELKDALAKVVSTGTETVELQHKLDQATEEIGRKTREVTRLNDTLRAQGDARKELMQSHARIVSDRDELKAREAKLTSFIRMVKNLEWGGTHPSYTYGNARKKVPCCPWCQGLNPAVVTHREAGHKRGCFLVGILQQIPPID